MIDTPELSPEEQRAAEASAFGARMWAAMRHARMTPAQLYTRLRTDYNLKIGRSSVYEALKGRVSRPRYVNELAEITRVNLNWLISGRGTMLDLTGRLSKHERAQQEIQNLLRTHIIPSNRNDLIRLSDRLLDKLVRKAIRPQDSVLVMELLNALEVLPDEEADD